MCECVCVCVCVTVFACVTATETETACVGLRELVRESIFIMPVASATDPNSKTKAEIRSFQSQTTV